ncbi:MAG: signal peptidase I [Proteobacteria bacterium]|nr:signal peptidase I [Pseudomonadota bacterium]
MIDHEHALDAQNEPARAPTAPFEDGGSASAQSAQATASPNVQEDEEDQAFFEEEPEDAPGRPALGISVALLGFLSPGTYLTLKNRIASGLLLNLGLSVGCLVVPLVCVMTGLFPVPLAVALAIGLSASWIYSIVRVFNDPPLRLRPLQAWGQAGFAFITFWLPCLLCFLISATTILQRTWMGNDSMAPGIIKGDIILVDRHAYWRDDPAYGDLVLVEELVKNDSGVRKRAFFGRIIAKPGDSVQLHGYHPSVNGKDLVHYAKRDDAQNEQPARLVYELPFGTEVPESETDSPGDWYPVMSPSQLLFSETNVVELEAGYYFILEDNRVLDRNRTRTSYGSIIHRSEICGRPQYVIYNTEAEHSFERYGLALR